MDIKSTIIQFTTNAKNMLALNSELLYPILQKYFISTNSEEFTDPDFFKSNKKTCELLNEANLELIATLEYSKNKQKYLNSFSSNITINELKRKIYEYEVTINNLKNLNHMYKRTISSLHKQDETHTTANLLNNFATNQTDNSNKIAILESRLAQLKKLL